MESCLALFTNGVFDIQTGKLRDKLPNDVYAYKFDYPYYSFGDNVQKVDEYMKQVFPDENLHEYFFEFSRFLLSK